MLYESLLSGSPIIPAEFYIYYGFFVSGFILYLSLGKKKDLRKTIFFSLTGVHGILLLIFASATLYILKPIPQVSQNTYQLSENSESPAIEITFDKPVMRKSLYKSITPPVPGIWLFTQPIYKTHLYRKLVFYPYNNLNPGIYYTVNLTGIRNFLNKTQNSYTYSFKTPDIFDVLGEATTAGGNDQISIVGSFPANGWDGISVDTVIRIRFNQSVNKNSAESRLTLNPTVEGIYTWDGETLIFTPKTYLDFDTNYTLSISSGVESLSGSLLNSRYSASFSTQEKSTKLVVPFYLQQYTLSCEAAALRMTLAYRGVTATEDQLLQKIGFDPSGKRGGVWGNPYVGFVGNVKGKQMKNGYGVYWEPIARAANYYRYAKSFENWTIKQLTESIQKSTPVIAWISIKGKPPTVWLTPTGDRIKAVADEHTVVVTGFLGPPNNPSHIIANDPLIGEVYLSRDSFEKKWSSLSNSGVLVF